LFNFNKIIVVVICLFFVVRSSTAQKTASVANNQTKTLEQISNALESGDLLNAKKYLRQIFVVEPNNVSARILAGIVADRENNLTEAEKHFAIAARLQPNSPEARNNYGAILYRLGRIKDAVREFEASLRANPNQPSAQANLAQIYFKEGTPSSLQSARNLFEKVFVLTPDAEIARALVIIALRSGEKERATRDFRQYANLAKNMALPAKPRFELGAVLLESGLFAEAQIELEAAALLEPNNVDTIVLLSQVYLGQKDIKNAGRTLETAVARGISDAKIYAALADVYQTGGYFENAIPAMRLAIEADKTNEAYRYRYGILLIDTKTPTAAVIRLKEAVKDFPRSARLWLGLGIAQFYDGKFADAQESLEKALGFDRKLVPALAYLAAINDVAGLSAAAATYYERALSIDEANAILHYLLADTLLKNASADNVKVEKHLRRAIELDAKIAAAHLTLGRFYVREKRFAEAAAAFEKTVRLEPNQAEAFYQLGQIYGRLKRLDESRTALAKFKELSEREKTQTKSNHSELVRRLANVKF
jgi:Tfp pilus assembly protein PilF